VIPFIVTAELSGDAFSENPPPPELGLGSGKFGTPCARMHFANAWAESELALTLGFELPHAASASAQHDATASVVTARRQRSGRPKADRFITGLDPIAQGLRM
jgi:hypothetical protein